MEHFGALNLRRAFLTTSIVAATCLSLTLVVIPLFRAAQVKCEVDRFHEYDVRQAELLRCMADNFDPQKGPWSYRQTQYNEAEKNRLLKRANALPQNDVRRADLLVTVIKCYGKYVSLSDKSLYAREALEILESADRQKQKRDNPSLSPNSNPHPHITSTKELIDAQKIDQAARLLSYLCEDLAPPALCRKTDTAYERYPRPNLEQRTKLILKANLRLEGMKKIEPPSHDLARTHISIGGEFQCAEHFNEAIDAYKKALEIDELCFPDKTIMFCDYFLSGLGPTSPILTDCEVLADAYMDARMYQEAAQMYRRAIEIESAIESTKTYDADYFTVTRMSLSSGLKTAIRLAAQSAR